MLCRQPQEWQRSVGCVEEYMSLMHLCMVFELLEAQHVESDKA